MTEENRLIESIKTGDERAFQTLYDNHVESLYRFMRQHSKDTAQVEDWVQRAFIKAFRSIHTFNGASKFSTWLFTIALNEMRTDFRRPNFVVFNSAEANEHTGTIREDDSLLWDAMMKTWLDEM